MAYHDRVIARMVSNLWFQLGSRPPSGEGSGSGPGGFRTAPALFGTPEHVPELTYIISGAGDGAIAAAREYHSTYGLNPQDFTSLENLVNRLRGASSHIGRMRVVAHVGLDTTSGAVANLNVPFFIGGTPDVPRSVLEGFGVSDDRGLRGILDGNHFDNPTAPIFTNLVPRILAALRRPASANVLIPFGLDTAGTPSGEVNRLFLVLSDLLCVSLVANPANGSISLNGSPLPPTSLTILSTSLNNMANAIRDRLLAGSGPAAPDIVALSAAVAGLSMTDLGIMNLGPITITVGGFDPIHFLDEANAALGRGFRNDLTSVKARFDQNSWLDFRGCRIGQDRNYLRALQIFFGRDGDLPPISGLQWFQSFPSLNFAFFSTEAEVDTFWNEGYIGTSPTITHDRNFIQNVFNQKALRFSGVDVHIDFWLYVSRQDHVLFTGLSWKGDMPRLPVNPPRLDGFTTLDFRGTITRIGQIFDVSGSLPAAATITRITNAHPQLVALLSEFETIAGFSTPVATELGESFQRLRQISSRLGLSTVPATAPSPLSVSHLQTLAERLKKFFEIVIVLGGPAQLYQAYLQVEDLAAQASPAAASLTRLFNDLSGLQTTIGASGLVPNTAPSRLEASDLQGYFVPMAAHLESGSDLVSFRRAVANKLNATTAANPLHAANPTFRFYFFTGLALIVDEMNDCAFYFLDPLRNGAMRSFMRGQWQGTIPAGNHIESTSAADPNSRRVSLLTETDTSGGDVANYINPYSEFHAHITELPGGP